MFSVIKTPLSLVAAVALTAACSSGGMSVPSVSAPAAQSAGSVATVPILASDPMVETTAPAYNASTVYQTTTPTYSQPTLAATETPLMIDAPSSVQAAPFVESSLIEPASISTFDASAPALSTPALPATPSYTIPAAPSAPIVSPESMIQPVASPVLDGFSALPALNDTSIVAASARTSGLPIIASNSPLLQGTVYATTFSDVPPTAE